MPLIEKDKLLEDLRATGYDPNEYEEDSPGEAWAKGFNAGIAHAIHDVIYSPEVKDYPVVRVPSSDTMTASQFQKQHRLN